MEPIYPVHTKKHQSLVFVITCVLCILGLLSLLDWVPIHPNSYSYTRTVASNKVVLHMIKTSPRNITLKAINSNVTQTKDNGINGGFFYNGDLLSIAVINNQPVKDMPGYYGSGWYNTDRPRGTLVWDDITGQFSVQLAEDPDGLVVKDKNHFWAQGGVSMGLLNEAGWALQAEKEEMPAMDEGRMRSGAVYDRKQNIWLIVTPTLCTVEQFRTAIKEKIGDGSLVDGIFLDGDGSSQMKIANTVLPGDHRQVYQMLSLIH
jgi:hypothetical protein